MTQVIKIGEAVTTETNHFTLSCSCDVIEIPSGGFAEIPTNCIVPKIHSNTIGLITAEDSLFEDTGLCIEPTFIIAGDKEPIALVVHNSRRDSVVCVTKNQPLAYLSFIQTEDGIKVTSQPESLFNLDDESSSGSEDATYKRSVSWNLTETIHFLDSEL